MNLYYVGATRCGYRIRNVYSVRVQLAVCMRTRIEFSPKGRNTSSSTETFPTQGTTGNPRLSHVWGYWLPQPIWLWVPTPVSFAYDVPSRETLYEAATDSTGENTRGSWNRFEHYKRSNWYNTNSVTLGSSLYVSEGYDRVTCPDGASVYRESTFGPQTNPIAGLPVLLKMVDQEILNPPDHLGLLKARSLRAMLPGIRPQLSLVNSVIELKDFKTLPRTIKRIKSIAQSKRLTLRQVLGGGSDVYLQGEFNILPLLKDISGIQSALRNTSEQVKKLLALERKLLTRHYTCPLDQTYYCSKFETGATTGITQIALNDSPGNILGQFTPYRTTRYDRAQFHAEIQYSFYFSQFQRENANILGLADSLGVNLNPQIIWNAIPWSFVIDWVLGVSQWLGQFKLGNLEPLTVIHRYLWSSDVRRSVKVDVEINKGIAGLPKPMVHSSQCVESAYKRELSTIGLSDISTSGVSLKEFSLAGALGLSRRR